MSVRITSTLPCGCKIEANSLPEYEAMRDKHHCPLSPIKK